MNNKLYEYINSNIIINYFLNYLKKIWEAFKY